MENRIESYKQEINSLNERLYSGELTLKEYTKLLEVERMVLIKELEKINKIEVK